MTTRTTCLAGPIVAALLVTGCGSSSPSPATATAAAKRPAAHVTVTISDFTFRPATVTVAAGGSVTWRNRDASPHTATGSNGFDTGSLGKNQSKTVIFRKKGRHAYVCSFHPFMKGTVIVR